MPGVGPVSTKYETEQAQPPLDASIARIAERQFGVVSLSQLGALGLSAGAVRSRVGRGKLHRLHRGVFAVGHPVLNAEGRWLAAVLACGPGAVLSHRSAAAHWGLRRTGRGGIDITARHRAGRTRRGIDVHRGGTLHSADTTSVRGIPCTTVARTLLDLADVVDRRGVERACEEAEVLRIFDLRALDEVLGRANGRRGAGVLRAVLDDHYPVEAPTRSELEKRFVRLCEEAGLPRPRVNSLVHGYEVDFAWEAERVIVETDGYATHGTRQAFERDRARDQRLTLEGWRVVRLTWRLLEKEDVMATVAALLGAGIRGDGF